MHDEYRATGDFHAVINNLTQGLRALPTDYVARVKNFLTEYLGSPRHPVPFGGRARDFEQLNAWLTDTQASPYLLLAAPAGRGKSALLLRWCQSLLARRDYAIAYFPVSIRFRTNLAGVAFPALVALLAKLHDEQLPADPNTHEDVWRGLLTDYMTRPLPDGRSLVLVLDGVDEAADWTVGPGLFPLNPPPGLRIVLSARYLANDQDAHAWLQRLGWTRPGLARTLELYPLDRTGIASVLLQMGFPLDALSTRINIVSELYRLSEGDPLLVRLYVDDLWERGEAAVRFRPEDLRIIRPGLAGYFERWWKDQRILWSEEAPEREATAQFVLTLLAGALGPLSKEDILSLAPDEAGFRAEDLAQHLTPLARFVTGDGIHQGYVFSHPRLGNYFLEEHLSEEERRDVEHRFLTWGKRTLIALNEERLPPEQASSYIVQYYGAHLERAQADAHTLLALVSNGWRRAWEKLDRANAGFLGDVERAWRAAAQENAAAIRNGDTAPYLGEEIRYLLSQVSVNSVTSNISPRLMLEAVKTRIWTPAQGLACIRLITDLIPRARELMALAPYVQEPLRTDIQQEALDTVMSLKDEYARLDALVELAPGLSAELLWQILEIVPEIADEADRAGVLAELAPALAPHQSLLEKTLDFIQEMEEEEYRALALEGLAPYFADEQHRHVLQLVQMIQDERYQGQVLTALIPHLAEHFLQDVLQQARRMRDGLSRIRLLTKLMVYLTDEIRAEVVQEILELERDIEDSAYRIEILVGLAPFLPTKRLQQVIQEIQLYWDENYRLRAFSDLIPHTPAELLPELQQAVLAMKSEEYRTRVLMQLIPILPEELLTQALDAIMATWDEGHRAELLAQFAPYASEALLPHLLEIVATIEDGGYRAWLCAELEASLAGKLNESPFNTLNTFEAIHDRDDRLQTLLAITARLSDEALANIFGFMLPDIFGFRWRTNSEEQQAHILVKLGPRLPEDWLSIVLTIVQAIRNEIYQVQVMIALAPRIHEGLLPLALDIIRAIKDREKRAQVLEVLVSSLPEAHKSERVQEMLQVLQVIKDEVERANLIVACAAYLPKTLPSPQAQIIVAAQWSAETNQACILKALAPHLPADLFEQVLDSVQMMRHEEEVARVLEALAPHIPERSFPRLLQRVQLLRNEQWRTLVLATVVRYAPKDSFNALLDIAQSMEGEYKRAEALGSLAPYVPVATFTRLWDAIQSLPSMGRRVLALGALALRMPEDFFPRLWQVLLTVPNEGWQQWVLRTMAPHMSESLFSQVWTAISTIEDTEKYISILEIVAPYVPESFFSQVWEVVRIMPDDETKWQLLGALARCVPEHSFSQLFMAAQEISYEDAYGQVLKALIPRIPEAFLPQFLTAVQAISYEALRVELLKELIPSVPEPFFPQLWDIVQKLQIEDLQKPLLATLAPHTPWQFFPRLWSIAREMTNSALRLRVLEELFPYLIQERFAEIVIILQTQPSGATCVDMLVGLAPHLSAQKCVEVMEALTFPQTSEQLAKVQAIPEKRWQIWGLAVLVPRLPSEKLLVIMPALLKATLTLGAEDRAWILTKLASKVPEELLEEMLTTIEARYYGQSGVIPYEKETATMKQYRVQVLVVLLPTLSQVGWMQVLTWVAARMQETGDANFAVQLLKAASSHIQQCPLALLYPFLHDVLHLLAQCTRRETLADLADLRPAIHLLGGDEAIMAACCAIAEVGEWWP